MAFSSLHASRKPVSIHGSASESECAESSASGAAAAAGAGGCASSGTFPVASGDGPLEAANVDARTEARADEASQTVEAAPASSSALGDAGVACAGGRRRVHGGLWGQRSGYGICGGSNQLPRCFGDEGGPANAAACGRCDLCSGALRLLHCDMPQRITRPILRPEGK